MLKCKGCGVDIQPPKRTYCRTCGPRRKTTDYGRKIRRDWYHADPRLTMLQNAKQTARKRDIPFSLSVDDVLIPRTCPVLGMPLIVGDGIRNDASPSIDRFIPAKGYVPGNVRIISWRANRIKCDATYEELRAILKYMES